MRVLDCFAGIGGASLGYERAGLTIAGHIERDKFCQAVLHKHWPDVPCFTDICDVTIDAIQQRCGAIQMVHGSPPCQPASVAGKRQGAKDDRWLWGEFMRLVRTVRSRWVVAENVPGFLSLGDESEAVFCELEQEGYEVWPLIVGADDIGAPHRRKRVWIVANDTRGEWEQRAERLRVGLSSRAELANLTSAGFGIDGSAPRRGGYVDECGEGMANGKSIAKRESANEANAVAIERDTRAVASSTRWPARPGERQHEWEQPRLIKFDVGRNFNGLPVRLVRASNRHALRAYGNSVIPQVVYCIGQAIMQMEKENEISVQATKS